MAICLGLLIYPNLAAHPSVAHESLAIGEANEACIVMGVKDGGNSHNNYYRKQLQHCAMKIL
jgi:hypothetical protein